MPIIPSNILDTHRMPGGVAVGVHDFRMAAREAREKAEVECREREEQERVVRQGREREQAERAEQLRQGQEAEERRRQEEMAVRKREARRRRPKTLKQILGVPAVVVLVWIVGLVVAFPFIPGSGSAAFKGIGVMLGLMISLGSSGVVNQVMSGFVALYSGAVHSGEYARVGDVEGTVAEVGFLATKVLTPQNEYITAPNSVLVSDNIINYSRLQGEELTMISTAVTIGYDTPWRQVQAMLLLAAERTPGIRKDPAPSIRQTALSDFYIAYSLRFVPEDVKNKNAMLSALHERILDTFNEFGVPITSPNYVANPPEAQIVPIENWSPAPAKEAAGKEADGNALPESGDD